MAPIPTHISLSSLHLAASHLPKRSVTDRSIIGIIIIAALLSLAILTTSVLITCRLWKYVIQPKIASRQPKDPQSQSPPPDARHDSHWARKNSNVLWSMNINDDDLAKHFSQPPHKDSRLYSIGSISTIGPLDTVPDPTEEKATGTDWAKDGTDVSNRARFEPKTTPTKALPLRRATCPSVQDYRRSHSFDAAERRKMNLAAKMTKSRHGSVAMAH